MGVVVTEHIVTTLADLPDGDVKRRRIGGHEILLHRRGSPVTAGAARCTHLNWRLPPKAQDGIVTCPFHGAQFDLATGVTLREPVSQEWQQRLPRGIGAVAAVVVPRRACPPLLTYPVS